jgi:hypothetical protein
VKTKYRGYTIDVKREICLGGWDMLYYSIFRDSDNFECTSGCENSGETVRNMTKYMKERIDAELQEADPWGELEEEYLFRK